MTYVSFLERMSKADDLLEFWQRAIVQEERRRAAADALLKFIRDNFPIRFSFKTNKYHFDPRRYSSRIGIRASERIYEFLTVPTKKTFAWEL